MLNRLNPSASRTAKVSAVVIVAAVALWVGVGLTFDQVVGVQRPRSVVSWFPYAADSRAHLAYRLVREKPTPENMERAQELARGALSRSPVNVVAVRTLALIAAMKGDEAKADRGFRFSERLSRRDSATQLWLIESSVKRNDIDAALQHYDRTLRTSMASRETLFPILARASADPQIAGPLARLVASRPIWWREFALNLVNTAPSPANMAVIVQRLRLDPKVPTERQIMTNAIARLVSAGDYKRAHDLYRLAKAGLPTSETAGAMTQFGAAPALEPFDWSLRDEPGIGAILQSRLGGNGDPALHLVYGNGRGGDLASRLLILGPGRYLIRTEAGDVVGTDGERPSISVACDGPHGKNLADLRLPPAPSSGRTASKEFVVPTAACAAQRMTIRAGSILDRQGVVPWIASISVRPM